MSGSLLTRLEIEKSISGLNHNSFNHIAKMAGVKSVGYQIYNGRNRKIYNRDAIQKIENYLSRKKGGDLNVKIKRKKYEI